ncbi:MAG: hypothetical protein ACRYFX_05685 [Janthinobacterium lividum]
MLPLPYTLRAAFGQFAAYLKKLRAELPAQLRSRTVKGQLQHYLVQPKALSDGGQATARLLLVLQINAVEQLRRVPLLLEAATDQAPAQRTPPPVATNNEALARARNVSARAIRDHLGELLKIGFLTRKVFHGRHADFELYVAPEFVWQKDAQTAPEGPKKHQYAPPAATAPATKVPPFITQDKQDKKEIEIGLVDKLVTEREPTGAGALTGHTGPQQAPKPAPTAPATPRQATKASPGGAAAGQLQAECLALALQAWHYAWKRLYPGRRFDEHEQHQALQAVWYGVYRGFAPALTAAEWQRYHEQVLQRIDLAAKYFERHPNSFAPSPYAEFVKGAGYFDAENARGFIGTEAWLARQEANNRQRNITRALLLARRQLKAHRLGIATKRTQALTLTQLFRHHETKLRAFGPEALQRYYAQVANPTLPDTSHIPFIPSQP